MKKIIVSTVVFIALVLYTIIAFSSMVVYGASKGFGNTDGTLMGLLFVLLLLTFQSVMVWVAFKLIRPSLLKNVALIWIGSVIAMSVVASLMWNSSTNEKFVVYQNQLNYTKQVSQNKSLSKIIDDTPPIYTNTFNTDTFAIYIVEQKVIVHMDCIGTYIYDELHRNYHYTEDNYIVELNDDVTLCVSSQSNTVVGIVYDGHLYNQNLVTYGTTEEKTVYPLDKLLAHIA